MGSRRVEAQLLELVKNASTGRKGHLVPEQLAGQFDLAKLYRLSRALWRRGQAAILPRALDIPEPRWARIAHFIETCRDPDQKAAEGPAAFLESKRLMSSSGELLGFSVVRTASQPVEHFYIRYADPPLDCFTGELAVFVNKGERPALEVERWVSALNRLDATTQRKLAFALVDRMKPIDSATLEELRAAARSAPYRFVVWSTRDLCHAILARDPTASANRSAIEQLDLLENQPYRTHGSTSSIMFFGRRREIDWMLNEPRTSYAIYGGRQLGKTSLLRRLEEAIAAGDGERTAFITCEGIQDNLTLGLEILKVFGVSVTGVHTIADFERVFRDYLRTQHHRHTVFIDEVDDVIDTDLGSGQKIFVSLRNIHNDYRDKCRFFFAGFKKLYSEFFRLYAPFQNFAEAYELKELPARDALRLIEEPLCRRLGLVFDQRTTALERIFEYTSGHPAFIQQFCKGLIARLAHEGRREITQTDIEYVYGSMDYRALVLRNHADNFREGEKDGEVLPKLMPYAWYAEHGDRWVEEALEPIETTAERASGRTVRTLGAVLDLRRQKDHSEFMGPMIEEPLLSYALLKELEQVVVKNWPLFKDFMPPQDRFKVYVTQLNRVRNRLAHCRRLFPEDLDRLREIELSFRQWLPDT